jgi:hypothetical protein
VLSLPSTNSSQTPTPRHFYIVTNTFEDISPSSTRVDRFEGACPGKAQSVHRRSKNHTQGTWLWIPSLFQQTPAYFVNRKINQLLVEPSDELTSAADLALVHGHGPRINWKGPLTDNWVHSNYNFSTGAASSFYDIEQDVFPYHPKGLQFNRIRPSYNASFVEPASLGSSSPLSYAYTWTSKNSSQTPSTVPCVTPSYAMGAMPMSDGVNSKSEHGYYRLKSLAERDEDETALLCQGESFDLVPNSYTREEYMDNYWKYFHPQFPIVHKATFGNNISPLLCAAMYAIGGQYSNDPSTRKRSRILHDRGVKILAKVALLLESKTRCND